MRTRRARRLAGALVTALAAAMLTLPSTGAAQAGTSSGPDDRRGTYGYEHRGAPPVTVATRNLYLGANILRPILAAQSVPPEPIQTYQVRLVDALANATDTTRAVVDATDFGVRAGLLADELAAEKPDLVGLQEVALWRSGRLDDPAGPNLLVPNATQVDYDFLAMLRQELADRGVPYRPVSINWLSDVEAPAYQGSIADPGSLQSPRDVRLTMRDVILKRVDSRVRIKRSVERQYDAGLALEIAGRPLAFTRGYNFVDVRGPAGPFRFANTHLEAFSSDIALAQVLEMLAGVTQHRHPVVLAGDFNSDPLDESVKPLDTVPHKAAYDAVVAQGFVDTWLRIAAAEDGWTSGLSETVDDETADGFDHRIDFVFVKPGPHGKLRVLDGEVTGDETADRDLATGLWPSDHAGVFVTLRLR